MNDSFPSLTFGSLFAGIGGIDLGLERAGFSCRWQVEIDDYCRKVLAKHWPDIPRYPDVKEVGSANLEPVDLVCGGFPCQPVSLAGKQRGQDDERWLWPEFARILDELRPRYTLLENVPGLLVRGMGDVLGDLSVLGYDAEWISLPAGVFGLQHRRWRVFIVAYPKRECPNQLLGVRPKAGGRQEIQGFGSPDRVELVMDSGEVAPSKWRREGQRANPRPLLLRSRDGVPSQLDRLRGLGNAVVPQAAEFVGRRILDFHAQICHNR